MSIDYNYYDEKYNPLRKVKNQCNYLKKCGKMKNLKKEGGDKNDRCKGFNDKRYSRNGY